MAKVPENMKGKKLPEVIATAEYLTYKRGIRINVRIYDNGACELTSRDVVAFTREELDAEMAKLGCERLFVIPNKKGGF